MYRKTKKQQCLPERKTKKAKHKIIKPITATGATQRADKKKHVKDITTVMMQEVITTV